MPFGHTRQYAGEGANFKKIQTHPGGKKILTTHTNFPKVFSDPVLIIIMIIVNNKRVFLALQLHSLKIGSEIKVRVSFDVVVWKGPQDGKSQLKKH